VSGFQIFITLLSLLYIYFAVNNKVIAFFFGFVSACLWAYEDFVNINLKFDGALQIFYAIISLYGIYKWKYGSEQNDEKPIVRLELKNHLYIIAIGGIMSIAVAYLGLQFFETAMPYLDATTTAFSIIASFLLVYRYIDNWIYWFFIDIAYMYIYGMQSAWPFVAIMGLYVILSVSGYFKWSKIQSKEGVNLSIQV